MEYTALSLSEVAAGLDDVARRAQAAFGGFDARRLNWRPDAMRWSVAQCFEHLIMANRAMIQNANEALDAGHPRTIWQRLPVLPSLFGPMLIRSQAPTSTRKFTASAVAQPAASDVSGDVIQRFVAQHGDATAWIRQLDPQQAAQTIMISPFARVVAYSVLDGCRIMLAHDHRHFQQAHRVTEERGFQG